MGHSFLFMKVWFFLSAVLVVSCYQDKIDKRKEWVLQYRGKVQESFRGEPTIEDLLRKFFTELQTTKNIEPYLVSDDEYLKVYWSNESWDRILDAGSNFDTLLRLRQVGFHKNVQDVKRNFPYTKHQFASYEIEDTQIQEINEIYFLRRVLLKHRDEIVSVGFVKTILKHNGQHKILGIGEYD